MSPQSLRTKFSNDGLETASPARIVVMAYDRLERDLAGALVALEARDLQRSHELLCHAQDLVHELLNMLDLDIWEHAGTLASIYRYVIDLLVQANVRKGTKEASEARTLLAGLGDAFRQAAAGPAAVAPALAASSTTGATGSAVVSAVPAAFAAAGAGRQSFSAIA
jgi:flagellar secretion chaperone FliS